MLTENEVKEIESLCKESRQNILKMVYNAQSGQKIKILQNATDLYYQKVMLLQYFIAF